VRDKVVQADAEHSATGIGSKNDQVRLLLKGSDRFLSHPWKCHSRRCRMDSCHLARMILRQRSGKEANNERYIEWIGC
jgi:hypothetical protein